MAGMTRRRQRVARVAVTLLALLVLLAAACGGGSTAPDGGSMSTDERIALVRDQRLLVRAGDGEEAELFRAAASNVFVAFPAWSPDGTRIAFVQSTYAITTEGDWGDLISVIDGSGGPPIVVW
ncbi:MAG: hypothetical protein O2843_05585, partial [Chloroflexi bacterium]|nr:hypothetical protein [Chloroflexota bacterium]